MADQRHRQTPEYTPERTRQAVAEAQKLRAHDLCRTSTIQSINASEGVHAGNVAHVCDLHAGHKQEYCMCWCGYQWRAFVKK